MPNISPVPRCATTPTLPGALTSSDDLGWGYCDCEKWPSSAPTQSPTKDFGSCFADGGYINGNKRTACTFPFTYAETGQVYDRCQPVDSESSPSPFIAGDVGRRFPITDKNRTNPAYWCPTVPTYDGNKKPLRKQWGYCNCDGSEWILPVPPVPTATPTVGPSSSPSLKPSEAPSYCDVNNQTDGYETDVDCGGHVCPPCSSGETCVGDGDCGDGGSSRSISAGASCLAGVCREVIDGSVTASGPLLAAWSLPGGRSQASSSVDRMRIFGDLTDPSTEAAAVFSSSFATKIVEVVRSILGGGSGGRILRPTVMDRMLLRVSGVAPSDENVSVVVNGVQWTSRDATVSYDCNGDGGYSTGLTPCVFPFTYGSSIYSSCVSFSGRGCLMHARGEPLPPIYSPNRVPPFFLSAASILLRITVCPCSCQFLGRY